MTDGPRGSVEAIEYYEIGEGRRLDVAGLDANGNITVAVEAERINHDALRAVPDDSDKMADCGVDEAIWVVMSRGEGHAVIERLHDPPDGEPRVPRTYAETSPLQDLAIDAPGMTAIYTAEQLRNQLVDG